MRHALKVALCGLVVSIAGCGETNDQAITRHRPQFDALRKKLRAIAAKLPPPGAAAANPARRELNPAPAYDRKTGEFNTDVLMYDHLLDPETDLRAKKAFDMGASERLHTALLWTGPKNPLGASARAERGTVGDQLQKALDLTYLVVLRPAQFQPPVILDDKTFAGGLLDMEGFLVDLRTDEVQGSFRFQARPDPTVRVTRKANEDARAAGEGWVGSSIWVNARSELRRSLEQLTGSKFVLEP